MINNTIHKYSTQNINNMKNIISIVFVLSFILLSTACKKDILFDTIEADAPSVSDQNWKANGRSFSEGGRTFYLDNPLANAGNYRDILFETTINSNDARKIDSISVELQHLPSFAGNAPQGWQLYEVVRVPAAEQSTRYDFNYNLNLDDWSEVYWGPENFFIGNGSFGITREDNTMRLWVHFNDGTQVRLAQVMFSYSLTD